MFELDDENLFTEFEEAEVKTPSSRKEYADGRMIYASRGLGMPKHVGAPILCDFGSAVLGNKKHVEDVQPDVYRAPEVILEVPWSYSIDVWNLGCMVSFSITQHVLDPWMIAHKSLHRSGTSIKEDTSLQAVIQNMTPTVVEHTSLR